MSYMLEQADVLIDLEQQLLYLPQHSKLYLISSGKNGIGEQENSGKTPRGWHRIAEKFGEHLPINTVFIARQPTGEIYSPSLAFQNPQRDWILSRILWLDGLELGFNQVAIVNNAIFIFMEHLTLNQWEYLFHMVVFGCAIKMWWRYSI